MFHRVHGESWLAPPCTIWCVAPGHGFEPRYAASKAAVLPLDDPGIGCGASVAYGLRVVNALY